MARFMKIPQYFGSANSILFYGAACQTDNLEYYRRIVTIQNVQALHVKDANDYIVAKFEKIDGWFPQTNSTFHLKFLIPEDSNLYSKDFGVFGTGDSTSMGENDFWGLAVRTDSSTGDRIFFMTISDTIQMYDVAFRGFVFSPTTVTAGVWHTLDVLASNTNAQIYLDGILVCSENYPFTPQSNNPYTQLYICKYGNTSEYNSMSVYVSEVGFWNRLIENRDILDLAKTNFIQNKSAKSNTKRIKIEAGKFYYDGYLHDIEESSVFIDCVGTETVYIIIKESLVTEAEDPDLLDNSTSTYNYGKPGMHRIKFEYSYGVNVDTTTFDEGTYAIKYLEFENGVKTFSLLDSDTEKNSSGNTEEVVTTEPTSSGGTKMDTTDTNYGELLSRYMYEMMGNFIYNGLSTSVINKDSSTYQVSISSGIYYLNGTRYELDQSRSLDVSKGSSITSIVNEYITVSPGNPVLLNQQPVAATYTEGGKTVSGITKLLAPVINRKVVSVTRTNQNGEDIIDPSAIKVLYVYKGNSHSSASIVYNQCSTLDGDDGDYYFHNGRIKWSPYALNSPSVAQNGVATDSYVVEYTTLYACTEGIGNDFVCIKGDSLETEIVTYRGRTINHTVTNDIEYVISAQIVNSTTGRTVNLDPSYIIFSNNTFHIDSELNYLGIGDSIQLYYSYNSVPKTKARWYILFFNNGTKTYDTSSQGTIDYKYYLTDVYTLTIEADSSSEGTAFKLYKGIPGYNNTATRASIPDTSLPIADIYIDPDGAEYCKIVSYNIYRTNAIDIRNLMKKVASIEDNIILSELEKTGEGKSDLSTLKGMYVDSLGNYNRTDIIYTDAFIDFIRERLYSGFDRKNILLNLSSGNSNVLLGREYASPIAACASVIIDSQSSVTGSEAINSLAVSSVSPQVTVYNDFSYNQEYRSIYTNNALDSVQLSRMALIPYNSEVSVYNVAYTDSVSSSSDRKLLLKNALSKFDAFFNTDGMNTICDDRVIVLVGKGFDANEANITIKVNGVSVSNEYLSVLRVNSAANNTYVTDISENGNAKQFRVERLRATSGWLTSQNTGITANEYGEFVVSVVLPNSMNIVTGTQTMIISRANGTELSVKLNLNGVLDSVRNVINTGSRGNITFYDSAKYSSNYIPAIIQPINSLDATVLGVKLFFTTIDYSSPILIDFYELSGSVVKKVLARRVITSANDFTKISGYEYTLTFDSPINIVSSKGYGIGICTRNTTIQCQISEIGKPSIASVDKNVIVSKVKSCYNITSVQGNAYNAYNGGKKGLMYELIGITTAKMNKNASNQAETTMRYTTLELSDFYDKFNLNCDLDPTIGSDRKISFEYSIDSKSVPDDSKTWIKITPYVLITPSEKFNTLSIRATLTSGNANYFPNIPCYPCLNLYKFASDTSYYSKTFESGISDGSGESVVKIYLSVESRNGSDYSVYISPDLGISWRQCSMIDTSINGQTADLILREDTYSYECRLDHPVILSHEIIGYVAGSLTNGKFVKGDSPSYLVAILDSDGSATTPNEVYNIDEGYGIPTVYTIPAMSADNSKVKLQIQIDPNCRGFRIYRAMNGNSIYTQIYSSIASTYVPTGILQDDIDQYQIPAVDTTEFPTKGFILVNNELIQYENIVDNKFIVTDQGRGYKNTTVVTIRPGDTIELCDYGAQQESVLNGKVPRVYSNKRWFEFIDDNKTYIDYPGRMAAAVSARSDNASVSYPEYFSVRIRFNNIESIPESTSIWNMICNVEAES